MLKSASALPGVIYLSLALVTPAHGQARSSVPPGSREVGVTIHATGTFDVTGPSGTSHTYTAPAPWARFIPVE